jgi:hypothetical protein
MDGHVDEYVKRAHRSTVSGKDANAAECITE